MSAFKIFNFLISIIIVTLLFGEKALAQNEKGRAYVYWGWNRAWYTNSDINLTGNNYHFILYDVTAQDRQSELEADVYLNPLKLTIPQTNFRAGYFFWDNWSIAFAFDHMKYVMDQNQTVRIDGYIEDTETIYNGTYDNEEIVLTEDFLTYEHTNGLNYISFELNRHWNILKVESVNLDLNPVLGAGMGILFPRTASKFLYNELADEFHVAGYGVSAKAGIQLIIFKYLSFQSECKVGHINMPDVRTTNDPSDIAKQKFQYFQWNFLFGATFPLFAGKNE